jgi:hypothetical protein
VDFKQISESLTKIWTFQRPEKKPAIAAIMGHIPEDPHEISETY